MWPVRQARPNDRFFTDRPLDLQNASALIFQEPSSTQIPAAVLNVSVMHMSGGGGGGGGGVTESQQVYVASRQLAMPQELANVTLLSARLLDLQEASP